jgi:hypothetical protein
MLGSRRRAAIGLEAMAGAAPYLKVREAAVYVP